MPTAVLAVAQAKSTTGIAKDQRSLVATGLKAATKYVFRVTPVPTVPAGAGTAWSAPVSTDDFDKVTITPGLCAPICSLHLPTRCPIGLHLCMQISCCLSLAAALNDAASCGCRAQR